MEWNINMCIEEVSMRWALVPILFRHDDIVGQRYTNADKIDRKGPYLGCSPGPKTWHPIRQVFEVGARFG